MGASMLRKGLATLVCLAIMSALWSWAASLYYIKTKLNNAGGSIRVREYSVQTVQTGSIGSIRYTNFTTSAPVAVVVTPDPTHQILSLTKNDSPVSIPDPRSPVTVLFQKNGPTTTRETQSLLATFVIRSAGSVALKTWQLQTQNVNAGGTITTSRATDPIKILSNYGQLVFKNYPDTTPVVVTVAADAGYQIKSILKNGVPQPISGNPATFTIDPSVGNVVNVQAAYRKVSLAVTTGVGITPLNPIVAHGGTVRLTVIPPGTSNVVSAINVTPGTTVAMVDNFGKTSAPFSGPVKVTLTNVTAPVSVAASFATDTTLAMERNCTSTCHLNASAAVRAVPGKWLASRHKASGIDCVVCHVTMPGPVVKASVNAATFKVTAAEAGTVGGYYCAKCHSLEIGQGFDASLHGSRGVTCSSCHSGGSHNPAPSATACNGCHLDGNGEMPRHPFAIGATLCVTCHNPHSTAGALQVQPGGMHFNNITSGSYPASYVTSRADCSDCHQNSAVNLTIRQQWDDTGHARIDAAAWSKNDFKTRSGCVQCHTTTGFIAYSTGRVSAAWGSASDKSKEILTCAGCHSDIATGALRSVAPLRPFAGDDYRNRDVASSNLCMNCHSGRNNGTSIQSKVGSADFGNLPFVAPHYLAAGANLHGQGGYHIPGQAYSFYSSNSHRGIGMGNRANTGSAGPCVACHMSSAEKHRLSPVSTDLNGAITGISTGVCVNCHASSLDATRLGADQAAFKNALEILKAMLARKGFVASGEYPYFNNSDWGSDQAGANAMGAAYNYVLLLKDPGAYVHNATYARKLIVDSIDSLHNGSVTGSIDSALATLVGSGAISQQAADQLSQYKAVTTSCNRCHDTAATGSHARHRTDGINCAGCHNATVHSGSTLITGGTAHLNGQLEVEIAPANNQSGTGNYNRTAASCSGVSCHGNGTLTVRWGSGAVSCESCHTGTVAVIDGVSAPNRSLSGSSGHGRPEVGLQCQECHDRNKQHLGGSGMLKDDLGGALNNECNYCHDDTDLVQDDNRSRMRSHRSKSGGGSACLECHDPHGTGNTSMIRSTILGQPISYSGGEIGLVNTVTNQGLCQVCHTGTKYYRAGVPETEHDSSGCLACHQHNGPAGAFLIQVTKQCDSCHGYPPAAREAAFPIGFGTMANWSSASFERYSGGGGAHLVPAHVAKSVRPSDGWSSCTMCHDPGNHLKDLTQDNPPVFISHIRISVDARYRFDDAFTVYTGAKLVDPPARNATGSCFNLSCHMSPSPRWSTER